MPSHIYSYSFEPSPDWSWGFGRREEIQAYLRHCADKYDIRRHIRFNVAIVNMLFDEETGIWSLGDDKGVTWRVRVVVAGLGPLSVPSFPQLPGMDLFRGEVFHTAKWNSACDLRGKAVGVIGTGASAVQVSPAIAPDVKRLQIFQRTAPWVVPKMDRRISDREKRLCRRFPVLMHWQRMKQYWLREAIFAPLVFKSNSVAKRIGEAIVRSHFKRHIKDRELRSKITPNYRFGCKRVLTSNDWYQTLARENVELVDRAIVRITERGVVASDGIEHELDVIIFATGFHVLTAGAPFEIRGLGGRTLAQDWKTAAQSHNGVTITGYPNLFLLLGPNSASTHTSLIPAIEAQVDYTIQAIQLLHRRNLKYVDVKASAQKEFNAALQKRMRNTVWIKGGCTSFYLTDAGENVALFPGFNWQYRARLRHFRPQEHHQVAQGDDH